MMRRIMLGVLFLVAGCATPQYVPTTRYTLDVKPQIQQTTTSGATLGLRTIEAARPYRQAIVYRETPFALREYENIEWAELPSDLFTRALADAIAEAGRFSDVGDAGSMTTPGCLLTGELRIFEEDRTKEPWQAICEVRLELRQALGAKALWAGTLRAEEPMAGNSVSALPEAMSRAVTRVIEEAAQEISAVTPE